MKVLFILIMLFPTFVFAESYSCKYEVLSQIKYINFDRTTHSHFTRCIQDKCSEYKYSVIFANNDNLIIGDKDENEENYFLFIQMITQDSSELPRRALGQFERQKP